MTDFGAVLMRRLHQAHQALAEACEAADDHGVQTYAAEVEELERLAAAHGIHAHGVQVRSAQPQAGAGPADQGRAG